MPHPSLTAWFAGYIVTAIVVTLVVILVALILLYARRIGVRVLQLIEALENVEQSTAPLHRLSAVAAGLRDTAGMLARITGKAR